MHSVASLSNRLGRPLAIDRSPGPSLSDNISPGRGELAPLQPGGGEGRTGNSNTTITWVIAYFELPRTTSGTSRHLSLTVARDSADRRQFDFYSAQS
jgi:hypothetical protein